MRIAAQRRTDTTLPHWIPSVFHSGTCPCGRLFVSPRHNAKYCCDECRRKAERPPPKRPLQRKCCICSKPFYARGRYPHEKTCSVKCRRRHNANKSLRYFHANREQCLKKSRAWRTKHRDKYLDSLQRWKSNNPEKVRADVAKQAAKAKERRASRPWKCKRCHIVLPGPRLGRMICDTCRGFSEWLNHDDYQRQSLAKWRTDNLDRVNELQRSNYLKRVLKEMPDDVKDFRLLLHRFYKATSAGNTLGLNGK